MKKLLTFLMMSILAIGIGWAETKTISLSWAGNGGDNDGSSALKTSNVLSTNTATYNGDANAATCTNIGSVYVGKSNFGLKLGKGSNNSGELTLSFNQGVKPSKIEFQAAKYGSDGTSMTVKVNGSAATASPAAIQTSMSTHTITMDGNTTLTSFSITPEKRAYLKSIVIYYEEAAPATTYAINIGSMSNGSVTASPNPAAEGVDVTLTASPADGYQLSTISATNHSTSAAISLSGSGNTRTFTMPAAEVDVAATFTERPTYAVVIGSMSNGTVTASPSALP